MSDDNCRSGPQSNHCVASSCRCGRRHPNAKSDRLALAGFLAGYRGLTREAYTLDLRQFTASCRLRSLSLFSVRRADIEAIAGYDRSRRIQAPATLLAELDQVSTPDAMAALAGRLPQGSLTVLAGAAHMSRLAAPRSRQQSTK
jgi:hypothetical protein